MKTLEHKMRDRGFEVDTAALDMFWKMIYVRHLIWYKRFVLKQPAPWTKNQIFLDYKFTNMYRELDRGTIYLLDHIVNNQRDPVEQVFNIILYRMFNRIATYDHIGFQSIYNGPGGVTWPAFRSTFDKLRKYAEAGNPLYTDAHMVCAYEHFPGRDKLQRFEYIFSHVLKNLHDIMATVYFKDSLSYVHSALTKIHGIGPFIGYEVAVDISYCEWNKQNEDEWVNPGPGCQRGLKRLFSNIRPKQCQEVIVMLRDYQQSEWDRLGLDFPRIAYNGKYLTLRNIEHDLCEFFKYNKVSEKKGRARCRFVAQTMPGSIMFGRLKG